MVMDSGFQRVRVRGSEGTRWHGCGKVLKGNRRITDERKRDKN